MYEKFRAPTAQADDFGNVCLQLKPAAARFLGFRDLIPLKAWMFVCLL